MEKIKIEKILLIMLLMLSMIISVNASPFSATWDTTKISTGSSANDTIILPITGSYTTDWGDGNSDSNTTTHIYASSGVYTINITNDGITGFRFNNGGDKLKIINISQWGDLYVGNDKAYFSGCSNMNFIGTDNLNLTGTTDFQNFFTGTTNFNGDISSWDTSSVTNMWGMFLLASIFNSDISSWDTSSVTNMYTLFQDAKAFNQDISSWDVSKVISMQTMFYRTTNFNQNLNYWNVSLISSLPSNFAGFSNLDTDNYPIWGTSPTFPTSIDITINNPINNSEITNVNFDLNVSFTDKVNSQYKLNGGTTTELGNISNEGFLSLIGIQGLNNITIYASGLGLTNEKTISFTIPSIYNLSIEPTLPSTGDNLTFTYNISYADDTNFTYHWKWYKNSIEQTLYENVSQINYTNLSNGDVWIVSLRVNNTISWSDWYNSSSVTINDSVSPIFNNHYLSSSSGVDDTLFIIYIDIIETSILNYAKVEITDPNAISINFSMNQISDNQYFKTYTPSTNGIYTFKFFAEDVWGNYANYTSNLTYTESTSTSIIGGGGGGTTTIDLNINKIECDIDVSLLNIVLTSKNTQQSITIKNNENFGYSPTMQFNYIDGETTLFDKLRQTNVIDFIETSSQAVTGVRLSSPIPLATATGEVVLSSDNCLDIIIPISIDIDETPTINNELITFLTDEGTTFKQKIEQLKTKTLYYDSPVTSVIGLTMIFIVIFVLLKLPITKKKKLKYNLDGAGKYITLGLIQIVIEIIIVFIILFIWQSYLL